MVERSWDAFINLLLLLILPDDIDDKYLKEKSQLKQKTGTWNTLNMKVERDQIASDELCLLLLAN